MAEFSLSILFYGHAPHTLWVDAFSITIFLIKRLPFLTLQMKTPYEMLHGKQPFYGFLGTFGYRCFPYLRGYAKNNFSPQSTAYVFIRYSNSHKRYCCLVP